MEKRNVENEFLTLAASDSGLVPIINFLYEVTGCDMLVCDRNYYTLIKQGNSMIRDLADDFFKADFLSQCEKYGNLYRGSVVIGKENKNIVLQVIEGKPSYGYLIIFKEDVILPYLRRVMTAAVLALQVQLSRMRLEQQTEQKYQNEFLQEILYNNIISQEAMIQRGMLWGLDFTRPHILLIIRILPEKQKITDTLIDQRWHTMLQYHIKKKWPDVIFFDQKNQMILLIPQKENQLDRIRLIYIFTFLQKETMAAFSRIVVGGVGCLYATTDQLYRAHQEAKVALETGLLLKNEGQVIFYEDLGIIRLLSHQGEQELNNYFNKTIGLIKEYDNEHQSELLSSLCIYLSYSGDLQKTSKTLFIHSNTLRYRLKKVEVILGQDLNQYNTITNLYAALQIGNILGKIDIASLTP